MTGRPRPGPDQLLKRVAELVDIPSVSHHETDVCDHVEGLLGTSDWLEITRLGNNLVARTQGGRDERLLLGGHLDTVPPAAGPGARWAAATSGQPAVWGPGATDMKGGLAVLLELALALEEPAIDATYVFYECEEVASEFNGLERIRREAPHLLAADAAVLAEPTGSVVEAGCQGTLRAECRAVGRRAHTARAWKGVNAIHRLAPALSAIAAYQPRQVEMAGCTFREGFQVVGVAGGVAGNVVPDQATLTVNFRFAPDRSGDEAEAEVRRVVGQVDGFEVTDLAPAAPPALDHHLLGKLLAATGAPARAKLGWTDVARFAGWGVPATNFGPGDPNLAHSADEHVAASELVSTFESLRRVLVGS
ncbi:MAG: succinyl-diaminopimelate desuccinylase [Acidimicrobiales bacterium]